MTKIVVSDTPPCFIEVTAPVLGATEVVVDGRVLWRVWCKNCGHHDYHGPAEGHRDAYSQGWAQPTQQIPAPDPESDGPECKPCWTRRSPCMLPPG